jgi:hypothetical protein
MGYNLSRFSVNRNLPQLDVLIRAESDVHFATNDPRLLAYKLREALLASNEFKDLRHYYEKINPNFTFKEESDAVIAEYNPTAIGIPVGEDDIPTSIGLGERTKGTVESARQLLDVIGSGVEGDKERYREIYFPNAILKPVDQKALWDWTETTEWGFIDHQEKGLTLVKGDEHEPILWRPEE